MDVPMSWLREYVDIDCSTKEFMDAMTMSGSKVEGMTAIAGEITHVVTGKILSIIKHPNADKLVICQLDVGQDVPIQIVTGATNVFAGAYVPVALDGATLAKGIKIKKGKLRGEESNGMLCSVEELGFDRHDFPEAPEDGIYIFQEEVPVGIDAREAMDLKDEVVEYEITSNRPDCFSILGIAREAAATFQKPFYAPEIKVEETADGDISKMIAVDIQNPELCQRYIARVVKNVKVGPSPRWMRKRLRAAGMRPINNIVDITNYVMMETGQPMHAFSIDNIAERHIIVRNAKEGERFTTLDGVERILDASMLVISDPQKAVAVAGVMGGENSMVSGDSSVILFESACFDGPNVRITAKKLGLRTDASSKFEKGLDPNQSEMAVDRAVQLVELLGAGEVVAGRVDCYPNKLKPWQLPYDPEKINRLLGTKVTEQEMVSIFERLAIGVDQEKRMLTIPTFRPDLQGYADICEEVARFYGYDKIEATLAAGTPTVGKRTYTQNLTALIKDTMIANGLCEAMVYSFESPKVFDKLGLAADAKLRQAIKISNPLGEDFSIMRTTTLNGILSSLATNYNRRNEEAFLFEVGREYLPKALPLTELPEEIEKLTIGMYGKIDFFTLKGILERLFTVLGIAGRIEFVPEEKISYMHPGRTATVMLAGESLGYLGELHPTIAANYEIGTKVYLAVLDLQKMMEQANLVASYKPLPKFPALTRDISMLVKEDIFVKDIEAVIRRKGGKLLERITLFDVYQGEQTGEGQKSVSYALSFRTPERTLVDEEVNKLMTKIMKELENELGAVLRDK